MILSALMLEVMDLGTLPSQGLRLLEVKISNQIFNRYQACSW